jgi:hypothetical protein
MPDIHVENSGAQPYDPRMEARVARLEEDVREVKGILARIEPMIIRIDATMPHLATKAELTQLGSELRTELAEKPSKTYMWGVLGGLIAAYAAGLAALAVIR